MRYSGVDRFRLRDGRIAEEVVYVDTLAIRVATAPGMARPARVDFEQH